MLRVLFIRLYSDDGNAADRIEKFRLAVSHQNTSLDKAAPYHSKIRKYLMLVVLFNRLVGLMVMLPAIRSFFGQQLTALIFQTT
jgi:hypothetical protein